MQAVPDYGESVSEADERGKYEQKRKNSFYRPVLNTCPSFSNEVKNLAKDTGIKYSALCTHLCPYRLAGSALPSQRQSVSLRFRVATLLKTQFACHRIRGKLTLRKKQSGFIVLYIRVFLDLSCRTFLLIFIYHFEILSSGAFCPWLKNDGRSELHFPTV